jgi:glycosyltransferase involved in cell wall biosynthesis
VDALAHKLQRQAKLRVGFDARWYNDSGVGVYVAELAAAFSQMHDELELVLYEAPANPLPLPANARAKRVQVSAKKYSIAEQIELARRCREHRLDLFHSPFYIAPLLASCPVVVTFHDLIPFLFPIYSRLKGQTVRCGYRMSARKAVHIIADSQQTARDVQKFLGVEPARISVVHLAAAECYCTRAGEGETELLEQKYGIRVPYVLMAGARKPPTKNLDTALRVVEQVRRSGAEFQAVMFGQAGAITAPNTTEPGSALNIIRTGYVAAEELAILYRHATAFLLPSLYEGFGLPLVEAMSCGCAVVASNGGALLDVAGEGAQLFDPLDTQGMADAVCKLLSEPEHLKRWRQAAFSRSREFSWRTAAEQTIRVYHRSANAFLSRAVP